MQGTQNSQNELEKEQNWRIHTYQYKTNYKATSIKIVCAQTRLAIVEQWNGIERPEITSYVYGQFIFDKRTKPFNGDKPSFQQVVLIILDICVPKSEIRPLFHIMYKY